MCVIIYEVVGRRILPETTEKHIFCLRRYAERVFFSSFGFFCWIIERDPRVRIPEGRGSATDLELCKVTVVPPQNMIEKEIDHVQKFFYGVSREDSDR